MAIDPTSRKPIAPARSALETADVSAELSRPPTAMQPHHDVRLGAMVGKYRISAVLGRGGMGNVYLAVDSLIQRQVAIKVLPAELVRDPAMLQRFLAEARLAGRLNHPNVVTIYEVVQFDGSYAIAMELVGGGSVQDYLEKKGSPGWKAATRIAAEACKALAAAHESGLIHRDIKPANLLLTRDGHVKVADFGLAKMEAGASAMSTQAGALLGTPAYMSPEQCRGDVLDCRTDIYSLGCTYYAMLTGKLPFEAASSMQVMFGHCSAPIPDPRRLAGDVPPGVTNIVMRAMAKNPADRYAKAAEMLADLRVALGGGGAPGVGQTQSVPAAALLKEGAVAAIAPAIPPSQADTASASPAKLSYETVPAGTRSRRKKQMLILTVVGMLLLGIGAAFWIFRPMPPRIYSRPTIAQDLSNTGWRATLRSPPDTSPAHPQGASSTTLPTTLLNSLKMKFVLIQPGTFTMGDGSLSDAPPHEVAISHPFYIGVYDATQSELHLLINTIVGRPEFPAMKVTWAEANLFCRRLSELPEERDAGRHYRLPTEAEWEYACRAGTTTRYAYGDKLTPRMANFGKSPILERSLFVTRVGLFAPNAWGLHDVHGDVWQWCSDFYAPTYDLSQKIDPVGPATGTVHVARGGCWGSTAGECASAYRFAKADEITLEGKVGFRIVCTIAK